MAKKKAVASKSAAPKRASKKVSLKKASPKKVSPKKATSKSVAKKSSSKITMREKLFKLLADNPDGLTGKQVKDAISPSGVPAVIKNEAMRESNPLIKRKSVEGTRGVVYYLTVAGKKFVEKGDFSANPAPDSRGKTMRG